MTSFMSGFLMGIAAILAVQLVAIILIHIEDKQEGEEKDDYYESERNDD